MNQLIKTLSNRQLIRQITALECEGSQDPLLEMLRAEAQKRNIIT